MRLVFTGEGLAVMIKVRLFALANAREAMLNDDSYLVGAFVTVLLPSATLSSTISPQHRGIALTLGLGYVDHTYSTRLVSPSAPELESR